MGRGQTFHLDIRGPLSASHLGLTWILRKEGTLGGKITKSNPAPKSTCRSKKAGVGEPWRIQLEAAVLPHPRYVARYLYL